MGASFYRKRSYSDRKNRYEVIEKYTTADIIVKNERLFMPKELKCWGKRGMTQSLPVRIINNLFLRV